MPTPAPAVAPEYRHLLVPLDGSARAGEAVPVARVLADRFGADVHTVSVGATSDQAAALAEHAAGLLGAGPSDERVHVATGHDPAAVIRAEAATLGSCLVCMSTHGRGHVAEAVVGSVARSVIAAHRQPLVAVGPCCASIDPPGSGLPRGRELVACVDGGPASEEVLPVAVAWADCLGLGLAIVTVAEPSPPPLREGATWHRHHGPQADAEQYIGRLADSWRAAAPSLRTEVVYDPIRASEGIRTYLAANEVGLLALTTHGRLGVRELVLGSGAADIIRASTVPVLVAPLGAVTGPR